MDTRIYASLVGDINLSRCHVCDEVAVWVHDRIVFPTSRIDIQPNSDFPPVVNALFNEARAIANESPKGAAALLRLCIQHLCVALGEPGKSLDNDIANLVSKGLHPLVQKSLDIVRVIGNESVHPGEIDLNDDRDTAIELFTLVNLIAEQLISLPKKVQELYDTLPASKLDGIEARNKRALGKKEAH